MWSIVIEIIIVILILGVGGPFWACLLAPGQLISIFNDREKLSQVFGDIGRAQLLQEPTYPTIESYEYNISLTMRAASATYCKTRNYCFLASILLIAGSYLLGIGYLIGNAVLFILLLFSPTTKTSNQKNLLDDLYRVSVNLAKWDHENPSDCKPFCESKPETLLVLYQVISSL